MTAQLNCAARIESEWASVKADLETYMNDQDVYEDGNDDLSPFCEYGLSFDYVSANTFDDQPEGYWRYQLSWGGPSDEIRFFGDPESNIHTVEYWFMDWFDGAHKDITHEEVAEWLVDFFKDIGSFDHALSQARKD